MEDPLFPISKCVYNFVKHLYVIYGFYRIYRSLQADLSENVFIHVKSLNVLEIKKKYLKI